MENNEYENNQSQNDFLKSALAENYAMSQNPNAMPNEKPKGHSR